MTGHKRYKVMSNEPKPTPSQTVVYQIRLKGHLDSQWTDWFEGLTITLEEDDDTLLTGPVVDQAALHGLLKKVRDLGMPLISVSQVQFNETQPYRSKKEKKMNTTEGNPHGTDRKTAAIIGVLFIIGTVTGTIAAIIGKPILDAPDYLTNISANESQIVIVTFLVFLMGVACAGIGMALYPIMKKYSTGLAIGVVGFRVAEGILEIIGGAITIGLLALSQEFAKASASDATYFQTIGTIIKAGDAWLTNGAVLLLWCIGALMYYSVFYQYRLVPRWLSVWGLIGITLATIASVLVMIGVIPGFGTVQMIASLPILLQEIVFAIWLIAKGVNPSAVATGAAKTAPNELLSAA